MRHAQRSCRIAGQGQRGGQVATGLIGQLQSTRVPPGNVVGCAQPQPQTAAAAVAGRLQPVKRCQHLHQLGLGNAGAVVCDDDLQGIACIAGVSTISTQQSSLYAALNLKKLTQDTQLALL